MFAPCSLPWIKWTNPIRLLLVLKSLVIQGFNPIFRVETQVMKWQTPVFVCWMSWGKQKWEKSERFVFFKAMFVVWVVCIHVPARNILLYCIHTSPSRSIQTRSSENSKILFIKHQQRLGNTYHLKHLKTISPKWSLLYLLHNFAKPDPQKIPREVLRFKRFKQNSTVAPRGPSDQPPLASPVETNGNQEKIESGGSIRVGYPTFGSSTFACCGVLCVWIGCEWIMMGMVKLVTCWYMEIDYLNMSLYG